MMYIIDTADIEKIKHINEFYPIDGVTTNPSIIAKEKGDFFNILKSIREVIGDDKVLCAQTLQTEADKIVLEGKKIKEVVGGNFFLKIPISEAGLKATKELKKMGIGVLMTAIFTPQQALLSAKAGADFVAPYVNRIDNISGNGIKVVEEMVSLIDYYGYNCKVMGASFKNVQQINSCALVGCHSVTINPDLYIDLISHPLTDKAVEGFKKDWESVYQDKNILDF